MKLKHYPLLVLMCTVVICHGQGNAPIILYATLWGTTVNGGTDNAGTLFGISTDSFAAYGFGATSMSFGGNAYGYHPSGPVMKAANGTLYCLTSGGGLNNTGTLYSFNLSTYTMTDLHDFASTDSSNNYGFDAEGALIQGADGLLYGITNSGGAFYRAERGGVMFSYNITTGVYTPLFSFSNGVSDTWPSAASNGLIYLLTTAGGQTNGSNILSYNPATGLLIPLYTFNLVTDGYNPVGPLIQVNDSLLYGVNADSGQGNAGVIFTYNINSGAFTPVYNFAGNSMLHPSGPLLNAANGLLYGLTNDGVADGTLYSYNISTGAATTLHTFSGGTYPAISGPTGTDGSLPSGALTQLGDAIFGTTCTGGDSGTTGVIFQYYPANGNYYLVEGLLTSLIFTNPANYTGGLVFDSVAVGKTDSVPLEGGGSNDTTFTIFPNPSSGMLHVSINFPWLDGLFPPASALTTDLYLTGYSIKIYDIMGQPVYENFLSYGDNLLDLSNQGAGLYIIRLQTIEGLRTGRFILTR